MKKYQSIARKPIVYALGFVALIAIFILSDCAPDRLDIVGTYKGNFLGVSETVEIKANGTYTQKLIMPSGEQFIENGTWRVQHRAVDLSHYLRFYTYDFPNNFISQPESVTTTYVWHFDTLGKDFGSDMYILKKQ